MDDFIQIASLVIIVSASAVMAPGPLFAANISYGLKEGGKSGLKMALGHTLVEFPIVILLGIGVVSLEFFPEFRTLISIFGAITLFIFAGLQIRSTFQRKEISISKRKQGPLLTGIALSALNPFFIIWWLTIGFKLISDAMLIWALAGILVVFGLHIWMDFAWLGAVAALASKSKKLLSNRNYKFLMICLSGMLVYFGITFLVDIIQPQSSISI